ncbi:Myb-like DNA-binding domain [Musa troglodytarum]|uniref:Myb-like DNA-binding domain n=1 Tax=Musa troglodytarum TaxID=320322 RepID=A0A9E7G176_9LILI|nr:Myb-like DNA-binding domain [Musa troglodytarum]
MEEERGGRRRKKRRRRCSDSTHWKQQQWSGSSGSSGSIRSHAQKYFLKVQKNGNGAHVPPPRPKRKAAHPYPQKASKNAPPLARRIPLQTSFLLEQGYALGTDSSSKFRNSTTAPKALVGLYQIVRKTIKGIKYHHFMVYNFLGSVFDPSTSCHLQKLREMDPIDVETILLLMRNLSINLTSPDFEDHVSSKKKALLLVYVHNLTIYILHNSRLAEPTSHVLHPMCLRNSLRRPSGFKALHVLPMGATAIFAYGNISSFPTEYLLFMLP